MEKDGGYCACVSYVQNKNAEEAENELTRTLLLLLQFILSENVMTAKMKNIRFY